MAFSPDPDPKQLTFLLWNLQSHIFKFDDCVLLNYVCGFDVLLFTETYTSTVYNVQIEGYESVCHRPKSKSNVKIDSVGIIL